MATLESALVLLWG